MATMYEILKNKKRVELTNGSHIVSPTNGPVANEVAYHHFVFRFDFKDWKIVKELVAVGEELMPHRNHTECTPASGEEPAAFNSQTATSPHTTRNGKLTRNHVLIVQEKTTAEEFFGNDDAAGATTRHRCKRKLSFNTCVSGSLS
ncbi:hypothetical protein ABKV19_002714 [Rosa sericea]